MIKLEKDDRLIVKENFTFLDKLKKDLSKNKIKIALVISAFAIALLYNLRIFLSKNCVEGFYDEWGCATCENGKWIADKCLPNYEKYSKLIEICASNSQADGCFHGNYYRELSSECKENPTAALCNGNYDYTKWLKEVNSFNFGKI